MIHCPPSINPFEFVRIASLRAAQLMSGCRAKVVECRTPIITAQLEVASGQVDALPRLAAVAQAWPVQRPLLDPVPGQRR